MKTCGICKELLPETNFGVYKTNNKERLRYDCKKCHKEHAKEYYKLNKQKCLLFQHSIRGKYIMYKTTARQRGHVFLLSFIDFCIVVSQPCYYCGKLQEDFNGIDRLNNEEGYILSNCVSCCKVCNQMKLDRTEKEFVEKCKDIMEKQEVKT